MTQKRKNIKRKKNMKRTIVRIQIGAITLAIFLLLMVGAALLTSLAEERSEEAKREEQNSLQEQPDETETVKKDQEDSQETKKPEKEKTENGQTQEPDVISPTESKSITVSAVGDCIIGSDINSSVDNNFDAFYIVKKSYDYFFQEVKPVLSQDDLTIINMEGTLTNSEDRAEKQFAFRGDPKYTQVLTSGSVEAANLANDHSMDYGQTGYDDTIKYMEEAGINTFGNDRTSVLDVNGIQVGLVGVNSVNEGVDKTDEMISLIEEVRSQGAQLVIVSFHWGVQKEEYPDDAQKALAHAAIDNGADLVLGHHPHVLQGIETYNGKKIVYSLGRFCFGGDNNPKDRDTMIFQQTFTFDNGELVQDENVNVIPCSISSVKEYNSYQPVIAQGQEAERIKGRIEEYSNGISQ